MGVAVDVHGYRSFQRILGLDGAGAVTMTFDNLTNAQLAHLAKKSATTPLSLRKSARRELDRRLALTGHPTKPGRMTAQYLRERAARRKRNKL